MSINCMPSLTYDVHVYYVNIYSIIVPFIIVKLYSCLETCKTLLLCGCGGNEGNRQADILHGVLSTCRCGVNI